MDENIESVEGFIAHQFPDFVASVTAPIVMVILLLAVDWRFGLASLVGILLAFAVEFIGFGSGAMKENMAKYQKASEENKLVDLETIRGIVNRFGEYGYSAIDSKNQVDMTMAEQIVLFCDAVEQKKVAETIVFQIDYFGGFIKYDLKTEDGNVEVTKSYYVYDKDF